MIEIYTDGSCDPNPGYGGWAYVATRDGIVISSRSGFEAETTNNRMEYIAAIEALRDFRDEPLVSIVSDSELLVRSVNEWMWTWAKKGFEKKPRANRDLVFQLYELQCVRRRPFRWIKAHVGYEFNELADCLANEASLECKRFFRGG